VTTSTLHVSTLHDDDVGSVEVRVLTPPGWTGDTMLPLVLLLHGAASSSEALVRQAEGWEADWRSGMVPPVIVACASTPTIGGFYLGPWETVVSRSLPSHVETDFGADLGFVAITGASMGGYGALKVAFAEPEKYVAVAAMSPVVFPGLTADDVSSEHRRSVLSNLYAER
jgi:S-formylglutathione hydrolase